MLTLAELSVVLCTWELCAGMKSTWI